MGKISKQKIVVVIQMFIAEKKVRNTSQTFWIESFKYFTEF